MAVFAIVSQCPRTTQYFVNLRLKLVTSRTADWVSYYKNMPFCWRKTHLEAKKANKCKCPPQWHIEIKSTWKTAYSEQVIDKRHLCGNWWLIENRVESGDDVRFSMTSRWFLQTRFALGPPCCCSSRGTSSSQMVSWILGVIHLFDPSNLCFCDIMSEKPYGNGKWLNSVAWKIPFY